MLPSIYLRIRNVMKAMREVVLPAIPTSETLARDQALLVIGHLGMIGEQWRLAAKFENGSLQGLRALGEKLLVIGCDEARVDWRVQLQAALALADAALPDDLAAIEAATLSLGRAIDRVISGDGSARKMNPAMMATVLNYGEHQAMRERCWFATNGLDPDKKDLPELLEMLSGVFDSPDEFRVDRSPNRHIAFGYGPHMCLGQHLAKMEMRILFEELLPRLAAIELAGDPCYVVTNFVGGLKSLPIRFKAA